MARQKFVSIAWHASLPDGTVVYAEFDTTGGTWQAPTGLFMALTRGNRPYIVLLEDGQPTLTFHYRNISEHRIVRSLKANILALPVDVCCLPSGAVSCFMEVKFFLTIFAASY